MQILIDPFDTLFFRDGKPFSLGEESIANTISLPYPSTVYGAILSAYISQKNISLDNEQLENLKNKLVIKKINLYDEVREELLYPTPYDLVLKKETDDPNLYPLSLEERPKSNIPFNKILKYNQNEEIDNFNGFLYQENFKTYLLNNIHILDKLSLDEALIYEYKIGIGLNRYTNSVEEGKIYRTKLVRLRNDIFEEYEEAKLKIFVEFEGLDLKEEGYLKFGGENKTAYYRKIEENLTSSLENLFTKTTNHNEGNKFKLYLLTPAIFNKGYLAEWMNSNSWVKPNWCDEEIELKLISLSIGKPLLIGGFDLKENRIKPIKKAVPEGSVYYFETKENFSKIIKCFHYKSISDDENLRKKGFGISLVGIYK